MPRATKGDIVQWFLDGQTEPNLRYMIVVCDEFDYDDYPVFVSADEDVHERIEHYRNASMSRVMEVYDLLEPMMRQVDQDRCWAVPQ